MNRFRVISFWVSASVFPLFFVGCTSASNPLSSAAPSATNYYTNVLTNYTRAQLSFDIFPYGNAATNWIAPIRIEVIKNLDFSATYISRTVVLRKFFDSNDLINPDRGNYWLDPGQYYISISFPEDPFYASIRPIIFGQVIGIGGYGSGVLPFQFTGGARYVFQLKTTNTSTGGLYLQWSNALTSYLTSPVNFGAFNNILWYNFIKLDGY